MGGSMSELREAYAGILRCVTALVAVDTATLRAIDVLEKSVRAVGVQISLCGTSAADAALAPSVDQKSFMEGDMR